MIGRNVVLEPTKSSRTKDWEPNQLHHEAFFLPQGRPTKMIFSINPPPPARCRDLRLTRGHVLSPDRALLSPFSIGASQNSVINIPVSCERSTWPFATTLMSFQHRECFRVCDDLFVREANRRMEAKDISI